jgi:hypothetical protein
MTVQPARVVLVEIRCQSHEGGSLVFHPERTSLPFNLRRIGTDQPNGPLSLSTIASEERRGRLPSAGPPGPKETRWQRRPPCAGGKLVFL